LTKTCGFGVVLDVDDDGTFLRGFVGCLVEEEVAAASSSRRLRRSLTDLAVDVSTMRTESSSWAAGAGTGADEGWGTGSRLLAKAFFFKVLWLDSAKLWREKRRNNSTTF
jgi:hypothetical protein